MHTLTATVPWKNDSSLLPTVLLMRWIEKQHNDGHTIYLDGIPAGNGCLPDLLRLCGLDVIALCPDDSNKTLPFPLPLRWEGHGSNRIVLTDMHAAENNPTHAGAIVHHGTLPIHGTGSIEAANEAFFLINLARLEDATAVMNASPGTDWNHILKAVGMSEPTALCPLPPTHADRPLSADIHVWNPLPIKRYCPVSLPKPDGTPPWGLCDNDGYRYPVQIIEGAFGAEMLTIVPLGPLESKRLHAYNAPVTCAHWEVSDHVLDNGLVRAELNDRGCIKRLSFRGTFVDIAGYLCQPLIHGAPLAGICTVSVLESGPVRAQVSVHIAHSSGDCRISYQLYAHEDFIHVHVHWSNREQPIIIDHSTSYRCAPMDCAGELSPWTVEQQADFRRTEPHVHIGCHWARLHEHHCQRGLAVSSEQPLAISARSGHLRVHNNSSVRYVLSSGVSESMGNPGRISQHCALPGRSIPPPPGNNDQAPAFLLSESTHLVPLWIRHVGDNVIELFLSEQDGHRGKAFLYPVERALAVAHRVDALGNELRPLNLSKEADGFEVDYQPYEAFLIRWTVE